MEAKKTKGKQKLEMKKIEDEKSLSVAFSRRKSGIHKKASELTAISAVKLDILMFSPGRKPFCYGNPSLQSTKRTSLTEENHSEKGVYEFMEAKKNMEIENVNSTNDNVLDQMFVEKERERTLGENLKTRNNQGWWEAKIEDIDYARAKEIDTYLEEFKNNLIKELSIRKGGDASHDQTSRDISNPNNTCESINTSELVFGTDNPAYGVVANFGPTNKTSGVLSNPTNASASGCSNIHEVEEYVIDASNNNQLDFSAMNQMIGINSDLTNAGESGSSQCQKSKGKQKKVIKKIEDKKTSSTIFTKRKSRILNNAYEISATCDAKMDILMFSPTGKQFCYGNPSLQSTQRANLNEENRNILKIEEAERKVGVEELNSRNDIVLDKMYFEEEREKTLSESLKERKRRGWWEAINENINYDQAKEIDALLIEFKNNLINALSIPDGEAASQDQTSRDIPTHTSEVVFGTDNQASRVVASGNDVSNVAIGGNDGIGSSMNSQQNIASIDQMNEDNSTFTNASGKNKATQI